VVESSAVGVDVDHIAVQVYGPRNQLLGHCRVPAADVPGLLEAVEDAKLRNAGYSVGSMMRWVIRTGLRSVRSALVKKTVLPPPSGE
jgi:hypothetical protein